MTLPHSEQTQELVKALVKVQGELEPAKKDSENPHFKSSYADLASCIRAARDVLAKNGLAVIQTTHLEDAKTILTTRLAHESGQYMLSQIALNPSKPDPQGYGAALTYYRRFQFCSIIGLSSEDDDGNSASDVGSGGNQKQQTQQTQQAKPAAQSSTFKMTDKFDMNNQAHKKYFQKIAQEKRFVGDLKQIATDMNGRITMDKIAGAFPDPEPDPTDDDVSGVEM